MMREITGGSAGRKTRSHQIRDTHTVLPTTHTHTHTHSFCDENVQGTFSLQTEVTFERTAYVLTFCLK